MGQALSRQAAGDFGGRPRDPASPGRGSASQPPRALGPALARRAYIGRPSCPDPSASIQDRAGAWSKSRAPSSLLRPLRLARRRPRWSPPPGIRKTLRLRRKPGQAAPAPRGQLPGSLHRARTAAGIFFRASLEALRESGGTAVPYKGSSHPPS